MPFAVELYLDQQADARVREMWAALDSNGVVSLGSAPDSDYHPHVSLAVFKSGRSSAVEDAVRNSLGGVLGLPVSLASLGFFPTTESVAFLGVVPTPELLERHRTLLGALKPVVEGLWPYYDVGALMPHCTLATRVPDPRRVLDILWPGSLPIVGYVSSAHLVEIPGGRSRFSV